MRKIRRGNGVVHEVDEKAMIEAEWYSYNRPPPKRVQFICGYYAKMSPGTTNRDVPESTPTTCMGCLMGSKW